MKNNALFNKVFGEALVIEPIKERGEPVKPVRQMRDKTAYVRKPKYRKDW